MRPFAPFFLALLCAIIGSAGCLGGSDDGPRRSGSGGISFQPGGSGGSAAGGEGGSGGAGGEGGAPDLPLLEIHAVHPAYGTVDGGVPVTITGVGFVASVPDEGFGVSTVVTFGGNPAPSLRVIDDTTILVTSPVGLAGDADIVVRNASGETTCAGCFHFLPPLRIHAIEPGEGGIDGGGRIRLRGTGLSEGTTVLFGGRAALNSALREDGALEVILPPGDAAGLVDVRVFEASRQDTLRRAFRYRSVLEAHSIDPLTSPLEGGGALLVEGEGFGPLARLFIDGVEVPAARLEAGLSAEIPPADAPGLVEVAVDDGETRASLPFVYYDPEVSEFGLFALWPRAGVAAGGTEVTLLGDGFDGEGLAVYFGETLASVVLVENPRILRAIAPAAVPGTVDVRVRTLEGMHALPDAFHYHTPFEVHAITPAVGPVAGGTPIEVEGTGFPLRPRVFVGALEAADVVRIDDGRIQALTPPGTDGIMPVRVVDADAPSSRAILPAAFTYQGPLRVAVAEPATGARAGGTRVIVRGAGFRDEMRVYFGENEADGVQILDPFTLEILSPRGSVGLVDLRIVRADGESATLDGGYYYYNPSSISGGASGGPLRGTLNVSALARSGPFRNAPIEGCLVHVGAQDDTALTKKTDERGEVTFSSPSLSKGVDISVVCEDYELVTLANHLSENATVLLRFTGTFIIEPPEEEEEEEEDPEPIVPPPPPGRSTVVGRVYGFKPPLNRPLAPNEELLAYAGVAPGSVYSAPPFVSSAPTVAIRQEGEPFAFQFWRTSYSTLYAVYGIRNKDTNDFEPLLLGFVRGITAKEHETVNVDLILDTWLNREVPVSLPPAEWYERETIRFHAFLDLGPDGIIPLSSAMNRMQAESAVIERLPGVGGEDIIFQAWQSSGSGRPWSVTYARQGGDPTQGVSMSALLAPPFLTDPPRKLSPEEPFEGLFAWEIPVDAPDPDVVHLTVFDGLNGRPLWHTVVAGYERSVRMPEVLLQELRARSEGHPLRVELSTGSQPTFEFTEWNYHRLGVTNFTSFTLDTIHIHP